MQSLWQRNKRQVHALEHEEVYSSHLISSLRRRCKDRSYAPEVGLLSNGDTLVDNIHRKLRPWSDKVRYRHKLGSVLALIVTADAASMKYGGRVTSEMTSI